VTQKLVKIQITQVFESDHLKYVLKSIKIKKDYYLNFFSKKIKEKEL